MESGKISESTLKRSVLKYVQLNNKKVASSELVLGAGVGVDAARLQDMATTTATSIGRNRMVVVEAMINAINNLCAVGAKAGYAEITLVLPEALYESELRHMMEEASDFGVKQGIAICGGHTTTSKYVTETIATVTMFGKVVEFQERPMAPGMDVVISKWIGLKGTAQIANAKADILENRFPKWFVAGAKNFDAYALVTDEAKIAKAEKVCAMHDVSGGGIFRALWELAERAGTGIRAELKKIPVKQETIEICEVFGLNPYELLSGGALLMVTQNGEELVEKLLEADIPATLIGQLTCDQDKVLVTYGEDGEELRYLDKPRTDEIDKIL